MIGLNENNNQNNLLLNQWYQLFLSQKLLHTPYNYKHWQCVKKISIPKYNYQFWKDILYKKLLTCFFIPSNTDLITEIKSKLLSFKIDSYKIVFVNGIFCKEFSDKNIGLWSIKIEEGNLRNPLYEPIYPEIFLHLTECLNKQVAKIYLSTNQKEVNPLYIIHISYGIDNKEQISMSHYRHHIQVEKGAKGKVIECFSSVFFYSHFTGARTSIHVDDNAYLEHIKLVYENDFSYHFSHNDIVISNNSLVRSHSFIFGSKLIRHQTSVKLNGSNSNLCINSLLLRSKQSVGEICSYVEHNSKNCISRQLHKVIAHHQSNSFFSGHLKIAKYAFKNNAYMMNSNLLLNNQVKVNSKPQLEIYADDVQCGHGATMGKINEDQLFYLCSRGISKTHAWKMLVLSFAISMLEKINHNAELFSTIITYITALSL